MKTIDELIEALESREFPKATGQFKVADTPPSLGVSYCCLGVYATINEMKFPSDQGVFVWDVEPWDGVKHGKQRAQIPGDHWLVEKIHVTEATFRAGYDVQFQSFLTDVNDETDDFSEVIRALKEYKAGRRAFPTADIYIEEEVAA